MAKTIQTNEMANEITRMLSEYTEEATDIAKQVVDNISKEVNAEILNHITFHDKTYSKGFKVKTSFENRRNKRNTRYVAKEYQLTHLLEYGHITRNGGRTRAFPHVKYGNDYLEQNFEREMKEALEHARVKTNT